MERLALLALGAVLVSGCASSRASLPPSGLAPDPEPAELLGHVQWDPPIDPTWIPSGVLIPDGDQAGPVSVLDGGWFMDVALEAYVREFATRCDTLTEYQASAILRRDGDWSEALEAERRRVGMLQLALDDSDPLLPAWFWAVAGGAVAGGLGLYLGVQIGATAR